MNKKVVIIACAVLAFFAGAIWVSEVPVVAPLVAFLEVCAGFVCGFFYHKVLTEKIIASCNEEIESLKTALKAIKSEQKTKAVTKKTATK